MKFPSNFMIGAATAAHQVEGNNVNSDFWAMELMEHSSFTEPSLDAVDHYHLYEQDIKMLADSGCNAYRFSIEWARIEPEEGKFDIKEIEHYKEMLACCRKYNIEPFVTLMHFSSPKWIISKGGWESESVVDDFASYVSYCMDMLGNELSYVTTINEVNMGVLVAGFAKLREKQLKVLSENSDKDGVDGKIQMGINMDKMLANKEAAAKEYMEIFGVSDPQCFNFPRTTNGDKIVMKAHMAARDVIKKKFPQIKVGMSLSLHDVQALPGGEKNAQASWEEEFLHYLPAMEGDDFLGIQNYCRAVFDEQGSVPAPKGAKLTQMHYEFYPDSVGPVIRRVAESFKGELIVTENGTSVDDDADRVEFIQRALDGVYSCVEDGLPVKGYFYWSLIDNFEWQKGYALTFGLIAVDRTTQKRTPKPSLEVLGSYASK